MTDNSETSQTLARTDCAEPEFGEFPYEGAQDDQHHGHGNLAADLQKTIETAILPRLMLVEEQGALGTHSDPDTAPQIEPQLLEEFIDFLLDQSVTAGQDLVEHLLKQGVPLERIYLDLLAPTARRMGEYWESDQRSFTDVTIGLCRLHEVLRHNALRPTDHHTNHSPVRPTILLSTACADQHVFGVIMVAEFFRKAGWAVTCEPGAETRELVRIASTHTFDVIGLSIARTYALDDIRNAIKQLRDASQNQDAKIMIGGALIDRDLTIVEKVGADAFTTDASKAPDTASNLLADARIGC